MREKIFVKNFLKANLLEKFLTKKRLLKFKVSYKENIIEKALLPLHLKDIIYDLGFSVCNDLWAKANTKIFIAYMKPYFSLILYTAQFFGRL